MREKEREMGVSLEAMFSPPQPVNDEEAGGISYFKSTSQGLIDEIDFNTFQPLFRVTASPPPPPPPPPSLPTIPSSNE